MNMQAVEFQVRVKDGIIEVPELYRNELDGHFIRVIVMKPTQKAAAGMVAELMKNPVKFEGHPLKREEIYDRSL